MIVLASIAALASPLIDTGELGDAAQHARGVVDRCKVDPGCPEGDRGLAEAFLVLAVASAVLDGDPDPVLTANARALAPEVLYAWDDLLVSGGPVDPWVRARLAPVEHGPVRSVPGNWFVSVGSFGGFPLSSGGNVRFSQALGVLIEVPYRWFGLALDVRGGRELENRQDHAPRRVWRDGIDGYLGFGARRQWDRFELHGTLGPALYQVGYSDSTRAAAYDYDSEPLLPELGAGVGARVRLAHRPSRSVWVALTVEGRLHHTGHLWARSALTVTCKVDERLRFAVMVWSTAEIGSTMWGLSPQIRFGGKDPS